MIDNETINQISTAVRFELQRASDQFGKPAFTSDHATAIANAIVKALEVYEQNRIR